MSQLLRSMVAIFATFFAAIAVHAASAPMAGTWAIENPSVSVPGVFNFPQFRREIGPRRAPIPSTVSGPGTPTNVGSQFTLNPSAFAGTGLIKRVFPVFPSVAQLTHSYTDVHGSAVFAASAGAGAAGTISFCPPQYNDPPASATGTGMGGNSACTLFNKANDPPFAANDNWSVRMYVAPGNNSFGGALRFARNQFNAFVWFTKEAPTAPGAVAVVSQQPNTVPGTNMRGTDPACTRLCFSPGDEWSPGISNYEFVLGTNPPGAYFSVYLNPALGSVQSFKSPNNAVGTRTEDVFDSGWGFKFTTGVISGSDGTPGFQQCDGNDCFFWVDAGYDMATSVSAARNIVMVAGAVARSTGSGGNLFHRVGKMHLVIPEPSSALGLAACLVALLGIATLRQRR